MNDYGRRALTHWERWRPSEFATIQDPEVFFSTLGETVASQVDDLAYQLEGSDPPGEGYLEKVGRLNAAKRQAEELVLAELVYLTPEPGIEDDEDEDLENDPAEQIRLDLIRLGQEMQDEEQRIREDEADQRWRERTNQQQ